MANPNPVHKFQQGNTFGTSKRRRLSESLVREALAKHGEQILGVLAYEAINSDKPSDRIKACDIFLNHTLLKPKGEEGSNGAELQLKVMSIVKRLSDVFNSDQLGKIIDVAIQVEEEEKASKILEDEGIQDQE